MKNTAFANLFPEIKYDETVELLDIWNAYKVIEKYQTEVKTFFNQIITSGERWDTLSFNNYNKSEIWWIIALFNDIIDPFEAMNIDDEMTATNTQNEKTMKIIQRNYISDLLLDLKKMKKNS